MGALNLSNQLYSEIIATPLNRQFACFYVTKIANMQRDYQINIVEILSSQIWGQVLKI